MDLETSMVAAAVTTKEGASATDRVMVIMKAANGIPLSAHGCSMEREARATDTKATQRTGPRLASGYSMVQATRATDVVTTQGADCSLGLRGEAKQEQEMQESKKMILKMANTLEHRYQAPASIFHLAPRSSRGLPWLAGPITWAPGSSPASSCDGHYGSTAISYV